jgi:hypothetical protein
MLRILSGSPARYLDRSFATEQQRYVADNRNKKRNKAMSERERKGKDKTAYPLRTASPNGLCCPEPPRNMSHIVSANRCACEFDEKPTWEMAPPRLRVTIFPLSWHCLICDDRDEQSSTCLPELQFCRRQVSHQTPLNHKAGTQGEGGGQKKTHICQIQLRPAAVGTKVVQKCHDDVVDGVILTEAA